MSTVSDQLENYSIYVILSLRAGPGFHWGIFVPTNKPQGDIWHAVNPSGGWSLEVKTTSGVPTSISLCLMMKVGTVNSETWETLKTTLGQVLATGEPSPNTGEPFTCRVWVKDALLALHNAGVIRLTKAIETIEANAIDQAIKNKDKVEREGGRAKVLNKSGCSTTS